MDQKGGLVKLILTLSLMLKGRNPNYTYLGVTTIDYNGTDFCVDMFRIALKEAYLGKRVQVIQAQM